MASWKRHRLPVENREEVHSTCCRSCATTASNLEHRRRSRRLAAAARRRAIRVVVATRAHQQVGRRLGRGLGDPLLGFQIGLLLGAPHLLSPARARYSWSAGLGWAEQSRLLRHYSAQSLNLGSATCRRLSALRFRAFSHLKTKRTEVYVFLRVFKSFKFYQGGNLPLAVWLW